MPRLLKPAIDRVANGLDTHLCQQLKGQGARSVERHHRLDRLARVILVGLQLGPGVDKAPDGRGLTGTRLADDEQSAALSGLTMCFGIRFTDARWEYGLGGFLTIAWPDS